MISTADPSGQPFWILGDYFMRHFYGIFDMQNKFRSFLCKMDRVGVIEFNLVFPNFQRINYGIIPNHCFLL